MDLAGTVKRIFAERPSPIVVGLAYSAVVLFGCVAILALNWSADLLPVLSIPLFLISAYYPRRVFFVLWLIWVIAAVGVRFAHPQGTGLTVMAILLGGVALYLVLELIHVLITGRTQTLSALAKRNRELAAVNQVTATITATLDLDQVLKRLVDTVADSIPQVASVTLQTVDEDRDVLRTIAASAGTQPGWHEQSVEFRPGEGIAGKAMAERGAINVPDVTLASNFVPGSQPPTYRSLLVVPLLVGERIWGTLSLSGNAIGTFATDDVQLVESLARQAAIAIENAYLYQETVRGAREQEIVTQIVRALNANLDVELAFPLVSEKLQELTDCGRVSLTLIDEERQQFQVVAMDADVPGLDRGMTFPYSATPSAADVQKGRVHMSPDLSAEDGFPIRKSLIQAGFRSAVSLPLIAGDRVVGGLNLASQRIAGFSDSSLPILRQIADALAAAMVKSELFDRVQAAEGQYRALFENSADAIVVVDPKGLVLDVNLAACEILGSTRDEMIGQQIGIISELPEKVFRGALEKALSGHVVSYDFSIVVNGKQRHYEARVERINQPSAAAIQWVAHDITDRRELDHWRDELTDITVHNLRNPLTWVQTGAEAAKMFLPEDIDPGVVFALDRALKGTARLEQQIDLLLNINRAEAGQELTDKEPLSVNALVDDVIELLKPHAGSRHVQVNAELPDSLPIVQGNRNMLSWTLENLVDNAIKYSPDHQTVTITAGIDALPTSRAEVLGAESSLQSHQPGDAGSRGAGLRVSVVDRGPGVPPADREHIFQKFTQARRETTYKGSGMGLYFCKLAVEAHGGRIWFEANQDGQGSTFSFTLPIPQGS